jgi:hypothetical protein
MIRPTTFNNDIFISGTIYATGGSFSGNVTATGNGDFNSITLKGGPNVGEGTGYIHMGSTGTYGQAYNWAIGANSLIIETLTGGEGAGIALNGDTIVMWTPGDNNFLNFYNEDSLPSSSNPLAYIDSDGNWHSPQAILSDNLTFNSGGYVSYILEDNGSIRLYPYNDTYIDSNAYISGLLNVSGTSSLAGIVTVTNHTNATSSTTGALQVQGGIGLTGNLYAGGEVYAYSDQALKTNLEIIPNAVEKVKQINGYTFERIDETTNKRHAGVIAQEVEKILPEVVFEDENGMKSVAYQNMVALLIEAIKEQQKEIDYLKSKLV